MLFSVVYLIVFFACGIIDPIEATLPVVIKIIGHLLAESMSYIDIPSCQDPPLLFCIIIIGSLLILERYIKFFMNL